jgi:hypothetical protein
MCDVEGYLSIIPHRAQGNVTDMADHIRDKLVGLGISLRCLNLCIDQLDDRHCSGIARSVSEVHNSGVTTLSFSKTRGDFIEQLLHDSVALHHLESLAARMQIPTLAQGHQFISNPT